MAIFDFLRKIKEKTIGRVNLKRELPLLRKRFYDEITDFTGFKGAYSKKIQIIQRINAEWRSNWESAVESIKHILPNIIKKQIIIAEKEIKYMGGANNILEYLYEKNKRSTMLGVHIAQGVDKEDVYMYAALDEDTVIRLSQSLKENLHELSHSSFPNLKINLKNQLDFYKRSNTWEAINKNENLMGHLNNEAVLIDKIERTMNDSVEKMNYITMPILDRIKKERIRNHTLYRFVRDESFFDPSRKSLPRRNFPKTHASAVLIGGSQAGKAIVRIISEPALLAWKKAFDAKDSWKKAGFDYVPVEPILSKDGRLRIFVAKNNLYRVYTQVLGTNMSQFLSIPQNKKFRSELESNIKKIIRVLKSLGISHNNIYGVNFCVNMYDGRPRIYIIDFDLATII